MKSALALILFGTTALAQQPLPDIKPAALASHIRFLADDLLEGRETGSRGFELAARYVASQFATFGLQPAGDDGTYFQHIRFRSTKVVPEKCALVLHDRRHDTPLELKKDFLIAASFLNESEEIDAPLVFAGYGITAPELKHDDYASINAKGKIVVIITGAPSTFANDQRAYYSGGLVKQQIAAAHGAAGMISLRSNYDEARYSFEKSARQSAMISMHHLDASGRPADTVPQIRGLASISKSGAKLLFVRAPMTPEQVLADADKNIAHSFPLNVSATIKTTSTFGEVQSENVLATRKGTKYPNDYVVVSAHLDHLGNHGSGTDAIYNGAYDNASGIAAMLEIARAFASLPEAPARSMIFVGLTGEEKGEQGSEFLASHPPAGGTIVADVNMDMYLMLFPVKDLVALGGEHSTIGPIARAAAERVGFSVSPDPLPEEVRFIRSDQYSFVKEGVPAISLKTGSMSSDPAIDGDKITKEWLRNTYHTPKDDMSQPFDWPTGVKYAQTNFLIAFTVANGQERPKWIAEDFFGQTFGR